ncbi:peptidoglycan DD-metalloendopeptidase family protein [Streptomyces sp. NPDC006289]|uniref:peptidoglycan DD-metalloendopeptidase family protein n=1 Tax=Streptomyces sp. NPDC006289 TaxID=3156744 RepID=UPI0033A2179A
MNDQHPHAGYVGYDSPTGSYEVDPLFGNLPGQQDSSHETYGGGYTTYDGSYGGNDVGSWDTGAHQQAQYDAYAAQAHPQAPQSYDTTDTAAWQPDSGIPAQYGAPDATGQWDTSGWDHTGGADQWATGDTGAFATTTFDSTVYTTGTYAAPAFETAGYESYAAPDTGTYDATAWNTGATPENAAYAPEQTSYPSYEHQPASYESYGTAEFGPQDTPGSHESLGSQSTGFYDSPGAHVDSGTADTGQTDLYAPEAGRTDGYDTRSSQTEAYETEHAHPADHDEAHEPGTGHAEQTQDVADLTAEPASVPVRPVSRSAPRNGGGRGRRRTPAKRSALLTVAVPSACVMSVAGIAAASVGGVGGAEETKEDTTSMAAADTVKPAVANNKLDTQLANLSADAENFADRASRTQERIDLKERQAADKKKREEDAARREAARPKFALPVSQHGLSASYGQAGVNWMSVHTGIDFPVTYGTPVMAATDGTVRTQWNSAYGNMAIVTAADGTETWYCHLSTTKIRSGPVKAGDVIAYSGSSGNSTGPHLHFEVRPGGGSAIDPMPWLVSHGLNPN